MVCPSCGFGTDMQRCLNCGSILRKKRIPKRTLRGRMQKAISFLQDFIDATHCTANVETKFRRSLKTLHGVDRYLVNHYTQNGRDRMADLRKLNESQGERIIKLKQHNNRQSDELAELEGKLEEAIIAHNCPRSERLEGALAELKDELNIAQAELTQENQMRERAEACVQDLRVEIASLYSELREVTALKTALKKSRQNRQDLKFIVDAKREQIRALQVQVFELENK